MKPALLAKKPRYPTRWDQLPVGEELKHIVELALEDVSRQMFGYHLVKLGDLSSQVNLPHCPIKHLVKLTRAHQDYSSVQGKPQKLPLRENSVDAFILAHELDFAQDPHQILREVDRAIIPNGHIVIIGFNPLSLTGLFKYLPINSGQILHDARFFSSMRIRDWLHLLGFEVVQIQRQVFSELFLTRRIKHDSRWQRWGGKYLSGLSALYLIVAKKRVLPLSLIKPQWKPKPNFSAVGASMRDIQANS